ncbi:MAG TPA: PQQ-dependent sugar dehydrogenase, partial [Longimicrobium sp.]|nr:PQQ-dependent sugar dehydrogenase [Longimicrobium sp.]
MNVRNRSLALLLLALAAACDQARPPTSPDGEALTSLTPPPGGSTICDADNGGLTLPRGFCALVVHDAKTPGGAPARARHIAVAPNGDVFVAIQSAGGGVLALRDTTGDGKPDVVAQFGSGPGHGIFYRAPYLYFAPSDRVERYQMSAASLTPVSGPEVIVSGMPASGDHVTKSIVVTADGFLYVDLGSASDVCQVVNRQAGSPGVDPCPELPTRAGMWRYNAGQLGQVHGTGARFATGIRNMVAMALNGQNGELYGVQHGRDNLNVYWPSQFTPQDQAELPAEELFRVQQGADYGWPYCYYDGRQNLKVLAPEYGGNGSTVGRCSTAQAPLLAFPAHWAPNGLLFHSGTGMPAKFQGMAFVAFHGGHNRPSPFINQGFNVVSVPFAAGVPSGTARVFADGFTGGATNLPGGAAHRPVGLAEGPDGSI